MCEYLSTNTVFLAKQIIFVGSTGYACFGVFEPDRPDPIRMSHCFFNIPEKINHMCLSTGTCTGVRTGSSGSN